MAILKFIMIVYIYISHTLHFNTVTLMDSYYSRTPFERRRFKDPDNKYQRQRRRERRHDKIQENSIQDYENYLHNAIFVGDGNEFLKEAAEESTFETQETVYNVLWKVYDTMAIQEKNESRSIFDLISLVQTIITGIMSIWDTLVTAGQRTIDAFVNAVIFVYFSLIYTVRAFFILNPFFTRSVGFVLESYRSISQSLQESAGLLTAVTTDLTSSSSYGSGIFSLLQEFLSNRWAKFQSQWNFTADVTTENSENLSALYDLTLEYLSVIEPQMRIILPFLYSIVLGYFEIDQDSAYNNLEIFHQAFNTLYSVPNTLYALLGMSDTTTADIVSMQYNYLLWLITRLYDYLVFGFLGGLLNFLGLRVPNLHFPKSSIEREEQDNNNDAVDYKSVSATSAVRNLDYIPDHVAIVLQLKPYDESEHNIANSSTLRDAMRASSTEKQMDNEGQKPVHDEQELTRIIKDASDCILWCLISGIPYITLYEESGALRKEHHRIIRQVINQLKPMDEESVVWDDTSLPITLHSPQEPRYTLFNRNGIISSRNKSSAVSPQNNFKGLHVSLISRNNTASLEKILKGVVHDMGKEIELGNRYTDQELTSRVVKYLTGFPSTPGLLILTESDGSTLGYPVYALKMTLV